MSKSIIFVMDHPSQRAAVIGRQLAKRGWEVTVCCKQQDYTCNYAKKIFVFSNNLKFLLFCAKRPRSILHIFTTSSTMLALIILLTFRNRSVYDPIDVLVGNQKPLGVYEWFREKTLPEHWNRQFFRVFLKLRPLQYASFLVAKNVIFRDLQFLSSGILSAQRRRTKYKSILFADYAPKPKSQDDRRKSSRYPKVLHFVSCGNLEVFDHGNGEAYFDFARKALEAGAQVTFYSKTAHLSTAAAFRNKETRVQELLSSFDSFNLSGSVPPETLVEELGSYSHGLFLMGEHYFDEKASKRSLYTFEHFFYNCGNRVTAMIEAGLPIVHTRTSTGSYSEFFIKRYGTGIQQCAEEDFRHSRFFVGNSRPLLPGSKFYVENNMERLEKFYRLIMR